MIPRNLIQFAETKDVIKFDVNGKPYETTVLAWRRKPDLGELWKMFIDKNKEAEAFKQYGVPEVPKAVETDGELMKDVEGMY